MISKLASKTRIRTAIVGGLFFVLLSIIAGRAVQLHIFDGQWLSTKAKGEYERSLLLQGKRGTIFDRNNKALAVSIESNSIAAFPKRVEDKKKAAKALAGVLDESFSSLNRKLNSKSAFVWIKRKATPKQAQAVNTLKLAGIGFIPEHNRFYPSKTLAAQILGFSGIDGHGLEGIEFYYNAELKGRARKIKVKKDALGRAFEIQNKLPPDYDGKNIVLTIDRTIQYIAQRALEEAVTRYSGKSGIAVVMDPSTGDVLALALHPFFNPNTFGKYGRDLWRNRAITDPFEPGSTMKIFSAAAAIDTGRFSSSTIFYCENGTYRIGSNLVHDTKPYGWLSLQQIVKYSSNIGTVKMAEALGPQVLHQYLINFGFGEKTGIACPGETPGTLSSFKKWSKIDAGAISFGQGVSVSAIQLISAASAIGNEGVLMKPRIVKAITDGDGQVVKAFEPEQVRRVVSTKTAKTVRRIMKTVISEGGTGTNAAMEGYSACGKTGTAQKIDKNRTYSKDKYIASFLGLAPAENPEVAILVVVDEPKDQHYGGIVAAPAFKRIAMETLNYMNIPPGADSNRLRVSRENGARG